MIRGTYASATGMMVQRRQMEVITNNITNVETVGYKKKHYVSESFDDVLLKRLNDPTKDPARSPQVGPYNFGTLTEQVYIDFNTGNLEETEVDTDLALVGDAFFVVSTEGGERYTKAGNFVSDLDGYLVNGDGYYVMGEDGGRVYVGTDRFVVDERGNVFVGENQTATIRVVAFEDNLDLRRQGDNLYYTEGGGPLPAGEFVIKQGFLENSNVETAREMVDMITTYRLYETNQRMLTMQDEITGRAVNDIGRLR